MHSQLTGFVRRFLAVSCFLVSVIAMQAQERRDLYARVAPSVVYLRHEYYFDPGKVRKTAVWEKLADILDIKLLSDYFPIMTGTAFFIDGRGRMITNRHVVQAENIDWMRQEAIQYIQDKIDENRNSFTPQERSDMLREVRLLLAEETYRISAWSGNELIGAVKVLAWEKPYGPDLALVEITDYKSTPLALLSTEKDVSSIVGQDVFSYGYPLGTTIDSFFKERAVTMNRGNVSAYRGSDLLDIQHSAAISNGNSGGPLLDESGQVIGVNTGMYNSNVANSLFYAVSAPKIRKFLIEAGYENILFWNDRLGQIAAAENSGIVMNSSGEIETSSVVIVSVPQNVVVSLDGQNKGRGQQALNLDKPLSVLSLTDSDGLSTVYKLRLVDSMQGPTVISPSRSATLAPVEFTSNPSGASVYVDDYLMGVTPLTVKLPKGTYNLRFKIAGSAFPVQKIEVVNITGLKIVAEGQPVYPVTLMGLPGRTEVNCVLRSGQKVFIEPFASELQLPSGLYELEITNFSGLNGVKIPIEIPEGPLSFDLTSYIKTAFLEIRGLTDGAAVWVDGVKQPDNPVNPLSLTIDYHTISVWQAGMLPMINLPITVVETGDSFVTWKHQAGFDKKRNFYMWTAIAVGTVGLVMGGAATYAGTNDFALAHTESYDEYTSWKQTATTIQRGGFTLALTAVIPAILAIRANKIYQTQMKELHQ